MTIRLRLQELAQERKLSLSQVQRRTGLTLTLVRRYWYNDTTMVSLAAIETLAKLLEVNPGDLFEKKLPSSEKVD